MSHNTQLPLAERTNIKDWNFEGLSFGEPHTSCGTNHTPENAKNFITIMDGQIVKQALCAEITTEQKGIAVIGEINKLTELNQANVNSTLTVNIAKNAVVTDPLYITYVACGRSLVQQVELNIGDGAEVSIVERFVAKKQYSHNHINKTNVGANAKLNAAVIHNVDGNGTVYYHRHSELSADASLETTNFVLNNSDYVFEDFTHLVGKGAEANVATVSIATASQKQNLTIRMENLAPHAVGNIVNYGIVQDNAHLAFNGVGKIHKHMNGGDNQQETRVLNLSRTAEAIANPFLLIDEGDITAGHAATIGQIDEEQVYYLQSRGLSKAEAEKLIVSGFLAPFADIIADETLKQQLLDNIEAKLG